ncbi:MAG: AraC family transcriptional regulator [Pseudohongiellaceae bacterium]
MFLSKSQNQRNLDRVELVLNYVHRHLDKDLSVDHLADLSGWSRWQLQRVFTAQTGLGLAQYVRELRLSRAAELLLASDARQIDIAFSCGFDSENSFSRSFKKMFTCSPSRYRLRSRRISLRTPISRSTLVPERNLGHSWHQIRIESQPEISVVGCAGKVNGLFSSQPDFLDSVPKLWSELKTLFANPQLKPTKDSPFMGVIDTRFSDKPNTYLASIDSCHLSGAQALERLTVPAQEYAVIPFKGALNEFNKVLSWFLLDWLPKSGFEGISAYDLEIYQTATEKEGGTTQMEYWVPVRPVNSSIRI